MTRDEMVRLLNEGGITAHEPLGRAVLELVDRVEVLEARASGNVSEDVGVEDPGTG